MKATTRAQKEVDRLYKRLSPLSPKARLWGCENTGDHIAHRNGSVMWCSDCGQSFKADAVTITEDSKVVCPHCGRTLDVKDSRKRKWDDFDYFATTTTCQGWQVINYYVVHKYVKRGEEASYGVSLVSQRWFKPNGTYVVRERNRSMNSWYQRCPFSFGSGLTFKKLSTQVRCYIDKVVPGYRILPEFKRMGVPRGFLGTYAERIFRNVSTPRFETVLKQADTDFVRYVVDKCKSIDDDMFTALKICFRNKYHISNPSVYFDYIDVVKRMNLDLHNPKFVCPADLLKAHDELIDREERKRNHEEYMRRMEYNKEYIRKKGKFFGMVLSDGLINLTVLKSIKEFQHEGNMLHHCVFKMGYYKKDNSLIMSARINGESIETVELSLKSFKILQCHGDHNGRSEYHDRIVKLVNDSIPTIKKYSRKRQSTGKSVTFVAT